MAGKTPMMTLRTGKARDNRATEKRAGFTLVELLLVMALLTTVFALAAPSLAGFFRGRTLDNEARRFLSLTRYAQTRAVSEGIPVVLWVDREAGRYGLEQEPSYTEEDPKALAFDLGESLRIEVDEAPAEPNLMTTTALSTPSRPIRSTDGSEIRFLPDGFVSETSPRNVWIHEARPSLTEHTVWFALDPDRLNYEIQTNELQRARR